MGGAGGVRTLTAADPFIASTSALMIYLLRIADFFHADSLRDTVAEMRAVAATPATFMALADVEALAQVGAALLARKPALEAQFGVALVGCEEPQEVTQGERFTVAAFFGRGVVGRGGTRRARRR